MKHKPVNKRIAQRFFSVRELKQNITHKKGHHGWKNLNQISNAKESIWEDSKDKGMKASKECKRHGNEEQMNMPIHTLL